MIGHDRFELVDLNLGCPVPKVTRRGAGAALAQDHERAAACVAALNDCFQCPITVKMRVLSVTDPGPTLRLAAALCGAGAAALTVHGRERAQRYSGPVAHEVIKALREELPVPVVANGGIRSRDDAEELRRRTGCDCVMVARGAIGNPWIFRLLQQDQARPPSHLELCEEIGRHVRGMLSDYGEINGLRQARKIVLAYLKGRSYPRDLRLAAGRLSSTPEFEAWLRGLRACRPLDAVVQHAREQARTHMT
jgi:nifR3 family TIM-barrel protein